MIWSVWRRPGRSGPTPEGELEPRRCRPPSVNQLRLLGRDHGEQFPLELLGPETILVDPIPKFLRLARDLGHQREEPVGGATEVNRVLLVDQDGFARLVELAAEVAWFPFHLTPLSSPQKYSLRPCGV